MKLLLILSLTISSILYAGDFDSCKKAVSEISQAFGEELSLEDFANNSFSDFELTIEEFNQLDTKTQKEIFLKTRNLYHFVLSTYSDIMYQIEYFTENPDALKEFPNALIVLNKLKDLLENSCLE